MGLSAPMASGSGSSSGAFRDTSALRSRPAGPGLESGPLTDPDWPAVCARVRDDPPCGALLAACASPSASISASASLQCSLVIDDDLTRRRATHWYALRHSVRRVALRHRWYLLVGASISASSAVNSLRGRQCWPRIAQPEALTVVLAKVAHVAVTHPCPRDAVSAARGANERVRRRAYQLLMCFFS